MVDKDQVKQTKTSLGNICYENNKNKNNTEKSHINAKTLKILC